MEILDLHDQFEDLVNEMQKLRGASALLEDNAKSSGAVVAQGEELLGAATSLLQQASSTLTRAADELAAETAALQGVQSDVRAALATLQQTAREQADRVEASLKEGLHTQTALQKETADRALQQIEEAGGRYQERLDQVHKFVLQFTKAQRGVSAEVKSGFASAAHKRAEDTEKVRETLISIVTEGHHQIHQSVSKRIDRMEAALVEQSRMNMDGIQAQSGEMQTFTRRAAWAALGFVVLQVGALGLGAWLFL